MNVAVLRKKILLLSGFNIKGMKTSTIFLRFSSCCFLDGAHGFCCFWQLRRFNENIGIVCFLPHFLPAKRRNAQLVLRNTLSMGKRTTTTAKSNSFMKFSEERPKKNTRIQGRSRGLSTQQWTFLGPVFSLGSHSNNPLQPYYSPSIYIEPFMNGPPRRRHATRSSQFLCRQYFPRYLRGISAFRSLIASFFRRSEVQTNWQHRKEVFIK